MISDYLTHKIDAVRELLHSNSLTDWLIAGIVAVAVWVGLWIVRRLVAARYKKYSAAQNRMPVRLLAYLIGNTKQFLFIAIALDAAQASLTLPERVQRAVANIVLILILLQVGLWTGRAVRFYLETKELERGPDKVFAGSLDIINFVASILIWSLLILVALDNLGVNITALLAGLGVGGVAVALALQNVRHPEEPCAQLRPLPGAAHAGDHPRELRHADRHASGHTQDARRHRPRTAECAFRPLSF